MEQKRRDEKQIFSKGGQAGSRGGCLKKGKLEPPYELLHYIPIMEYTEAELSLPTGLEIKMI